MLFYFILGALFMTVGVPLLQIIVSIVTAWSELVVYKFAFKVYELKKQMDVDDQDQQEGKKFPMGFQTTDVIGAVIENPDYEEQEEQEEQ